LLVHDTWTDRDLPVLEATVALLEQSFMVTVTDIAARTGFEPSVVATALETLDPIYVDFRKTVTGGDPRFWYVYKATPEARRAVGQWPTAEALASRLAEELTAAARQEPDADQRSLLVYAARLIGDTLREATVRAAGHVLAPAFGGIPVPELGMPVPQSESQQPAENYPSLPEPPELPLRPLPEPDLTDPSVPVTSAVSAPPEEAGSPDPDVWSEPDEVAAP
jgi:predicted transcriptional regulator